MLLGECFTEHVLIVDGDSLWDQMCILPTIVLLEKELS